MGVFVSGCACASACVRATYGSLFSFFKKVLSRVSRKGGTFEILAFFFFEREGEILFGPPPWPPQTR